MKKILLCLFMALFILSSLCLCAFAESETTSVEYSEWFGGTSEVIDCYSYYASVPSDPYTICSHLPYRESHACTAARDFSIGSYSIVTGDSFYVAIVSGGYCSLYINGTEQGHLFSVDTTIYIEESSFVGYVSEVRECIPVYVTVGSDGFVTSGFLSSLGIVGDVLGFILGSPLLAVIGLSVGVFLLGWGITSVKDLIKGY